MQAMIRGEVIIKDNTAAARMRRRREKARAELRCLVNPAHPAPPGRVVCEACNDAAKHRHATRTAPIAIEDESDLAADPF